MLTHNELLQLQNTTDQASTNNQNSTQPVNTQLVEREYYKEGLPFEIVGNIELGYFVSIANYRLTENQTREECFEAIEDKDWQFILSLMHAICEMNKKYHEELEKQEIMQKSLNGVNRTMHNDEVNK